MIRSLLLGFLALAALVAGASPPATAQCTGLPAANTVCAGPATGTGFPGFRALVAADVPAVAMGGSLTGTFPNPTIANGAINNAMLASGTFSNITGLGTATFTALTGATITGLNNPTNATDAANKSYVDSVAVGLIPLTSARLGTAAVLPNTPTYANGASGVGATLTAGANAALTVDGTVVSASDRVLVKTQAAPAQNGVYVVTTVGDGSTPWVLTRSTDFDTAAEMLRGSFVFVTAGSNNAGSGWALASTVTTVGTTAANFNQISSNTTYSSTSPIMLSGTVFSLGTVGVANGGTGLTTGTSGGVLAFTGATTLASSAALTTNGFVLGGGAGAVPTSTARPTAGQLCFGQSSGACAMAVLSGDVVNTAAGVATIQAGVIVNSYVNASAAIASTKLNYTNPASGGLSRTVSQRLSQTFIDAKDFLACDNSTNDTAAWASMIAAVPTSPGVGAIILMPPGGICKVSSVTINKRAVTIRCQGWGDSSGAATIIRGTSATLNLINITSPYVTVEDCSFDFSGVTRTAGCTLNANVDAQAMFLRKLVISGSYHGVCSAAAATIAEWVTVSNGCAGNGFYFAGTDINGVTLLNTQANSCQVGYQFAGTGVGVYTSFAGCDQAYINCWDYDGTWQDVTMYISGGSTRASSTGVINFHNNTGNNIQITDCLVEGFGNPLVGVWMGVNTHGVSIKGCNISGATYGITVDGHSVSIGNNQFSNNSYNILMSAGSAHTTLTGNVSTANPLPLSIYGVAFAPGAGSILCAGTDFTAVVSGTINGTLPAGSSVAACPGF